MNTTVLAGHILSEFSAFESVDNTLIGGANPLCFRADAVYPNQADQRSIRKRSLYQRTATVRAVKATACYQGEIARFSWIDKGHTILADGCFCFSCFNSNSNIFN